MCHSGFLLSHMTGTMLKRERNSQKAIELRPDYATAHQYYAYYLTAMGRLDEATSERKRAVWIETKVPAPQHSSWRGILSGAALQRKHWAQPAGPSRLIRTMPTPLSISDAPMSNWECTLKRSEPKSILAFAPDDPALLALLGHLEAVSGRQTAARQIIARLQHMGADKKRYVPSLYVALV